MTQGKIVNDNESQLIKIATLWNIEGQVKGISFHHGRILVQDSKSLETHIVDLVSSKTLKSLMGIVKFANSKDKIIHLTDDGEIYIINAISLEVEQHFNLANHFVLPVQATLLDVQLNVENKLLFVLNKHSHILFVFDLVSSSLRFSYDLANVRRGTQADSIAFLAEIHCLIIRLRNFSDEPKNHYRACLILDSRTGKLIPELADASDLYIATNLEAMFVSKQNQLMVLSTVNWMKLHDLSDYKFKSLNPSQDILLLEHKETAQFARLNLSINSFIRSKIVGKYLGLRSDVFSTSNDFRYLPILSGDTEQSIIIIDMDDGKPVNTVGRLDGEVFSVNVAPDGSSVVMNIRSNEDILVNLTTKQKTSLPASFSAYSRDGRFLLLAESLVFDVITKEIVREYSGTGGYFTPDKHIYVLPLSNAFETKLLDGTTFREQATIPLNLGPWIHYPIGQSYAMNDEILIWYFAPLRVGEAVKICIHLASGTIIGLEHQGYEVHAQDENYFVSSTDHFIEIYGYAKPASKMPTPRPDSVLAGITSRDIRVFKHPSDDAEYHQPDAEFNNEMDVHWGANGSPRFEWFIVALVGKSHDGKWFYNQHFDGWLSADDLYPITAWDKLAVLDVDKPIQSLRNQTENSGLV